MSHPLRALRDTTSLMLLSFLFFFGLSAFAAEKDKKTPVPPPPPVSASKDEKLDVSDLEKKYWAAKDTDFSVVQNRLYTKANRFAASLHYGSLINEPWSQGPAYGLSGNYYFSERYGVQLTYHAVNSSDNDAVTRLASDQNGFPNHGLNKGYYGASFNWIPFYAKMSVLNSKIIYFDMSISPGLGMTVYDQQREQGAVRKSSPTFSIDICQQFFLTNHFAIRFDFINRWFQEEVLWYRVSNQNRPTDSGISRTSVVLFGLTFFY